MKNGLVPARLAPGRCGSTPSPAMGASTVSVAIASIKPSRRTERRRGAGRPSARAEAPAGRPTSDCGAASPPMTGSRRVGSSSPTTAVTPARLAILRAFHKPWTTMPASTSTASTIRAVVRFSVIASTSYAASAMDSAASMSTATMRDTPCSCIVTPISCSAISIAILLWEMNRNWVPLNDISLTSFA